jgi:hypothetical protein
MNSTAVPERRFIPKLCNKQATAVRIQKTAELSIGERTLRSQVETPGAANALDFS